MVMKRRYALFFLTALISTAFIAAEDAEKENTIEVTGTEVQEQAQKLSIDLSQEAREEMGALLNTLLADEYVLYVKLQNFHWNVYGPFFNDLHAFFQELYEQQRPIIDTIAERARALGVKADGSMSTFVEKSRLSEQDNGVPSANQMLKILLDDYLTIIKNLRGSVERTGELKDWADEDLLITLIKKHEKTTWMLRSLLAKHPDK